ncbi:hypothetical protein Hanom_Chr12g01150881 [Helianthus anomalus]
MHHLILPSVFRSNPSLFYLLSNYFIQSFLAGFIGGFCFLVVDVCRMGSNFKSDSTDYISAFVTSVQIFGGILVP